MAVPIQKLRELIFQLLYSQDLGVASLDDVSHLLAKELEISRQALQIAQAKAERILAKRAEIDEQIAAASHSYAFKRIQSVERNVLRLATYELLYEKEIPPKVAIAEAIRLTRKFSTPEAASFVNALLDQLFKADQGEPLNQALLEESARLLLASEERAIQANQSPPATD